MLERKGNPLTLLVGMQTSTATMENSLEIPLKTGNRIAIHSHESAMGVQVFPILNPLLPPSPSSPSGSFQCTNPEHPVSCIEPGLAVCFTYDNTHVSMLFSQIIPPLPSPTESKSLFFTSVSLLLSCI